MKQTEDRYLRLWQIVGSTKHDTRPMIPVSRSTWLAGVKSGRFPQPVKLGPRVTVWLHSDVKKLMEREHGN